MFNFLYNINFKKVIIIFIVGLVSRIAVNYVYDINVFKDYTDIISFIYCGGFAYFVATINDLFMCKVGLSSEDIVRPSLEDFKSNVLFLDKHSDKNHSSSNSNSKRGYFTRRHTGSKNSNPNKEYYTHVKGRQPTGVVNDKVIDQSKAQHNTYDWPHPLSKNQPIKWIDSKTGQIHYYNVDTSIYKDVNTWNRYYGQPLNRVDNILIPVNTLYSPTMLNSPYNPSSYYPNNGTTYASNLHASQTPMESRADIPYTPYSTRTSYEERCAQYNHNIATYNNPGSGNSKLVTPPTPKMSKLNTPSTMSGLFPNQSSNNSSGYVNNDRNTRYSKYTNNTNHSTIGSDNGDVNTMDLRKRMIMMRVQEGINNLESTNKVDPNYSGSSKSSSSRSWKDKLFSPRRRK